MEVARKAKLQFQGLDLSPNHAAFIELGERRNVAYSAAIVCDSQRSFDACREMVDDVIFLPAEKLRKSLSREVWLATRLAIVSEWLDMILSRPASMLAIEGYAYSKGTGAYEIGEVGGYARLLAGRRCTPYRLINPKSVKTYAELKGKEKPIDFCADMYGLCWSEANDGLKTPETAGDLSDATVLANMAFDVWRAESGQTLVRLRKPIPDLVKNQPTLIGAK